MVALSVCCALCSLSSASRADQPKPVKSAPVKSAAVKSAAVKSAVVPPSAATAKPKAAVPTPALVREDCAAVIRGKAELPARMAELMLELASALDAHAHWVSASSDRAARAEAAQLRRLAREHRALSASMKRLATNMERARFAAAPHDSTRMDPKLHQAMANQVTLERGVADLLRKDAAATEQLMATRSPKGPHR